MPGILKTVAQRVMLDGDQLKGSSLVAFERTFGVKPSSLATATAGLGMSRVNDPIRALVTGNGAQPDKAAIAFGPSAGIVLGVSIGSTSIRAALVDANGWIYHKQTGKPMAAQRTAAPSVLFDRIKTIAEQVLHLGLRDERLLVQGRLPFLGIAVAWPAPLDRDKHRRGALSHPDWEDSGGGINEALAKHLDIDPRRSHALNDAEAALLAATFDYTRSPEYAQQVRPELAMLVRIGGGIGAAAMGVEPAKEGVSGWMTSRLIGGHHGLAGEIGHTTVSPTLLASLKESRHGECPDLKRIRCSCARQGEKPDHVEAYASGAAVVARFAKRDAEHRPETVDQIMAETAVAPYTCALREAGVIVGDALIPVILMLNPTRIVLSGRLSTPTVGGALADHLQKAKTIVRLFGAIPDIRTLSGDDNAFIGVRGAALAVLRRHVHARIDDLYGNKSNLLPAGFAALTEGITKCAWE